MGRQQNLQLLRSAAGMLKPVLEELVFVGGCTTALLITDKAAADVRPTFDVDAIIELSSYADYVHFSERLRSLGLQEDQSEDAPICRWRANDLVLDVMPDNESILGFTNRWYKHVLQTANRLKIDEEGTKIRVVTAPYFAGTKLEAFKGRGHGDFAMSQDLEDLISVVDGRSSIVEEIRSSQAELKTYVVTEIKTLLASEDFIAALPGFLLPDRASQRRLPALLDKLKQFTTLT